MLYSRPQRHDRTCWYSGLSATSPPQLFADLQQLAKAEAGSPVWWITLDRNARLQILVAVPHTKRSVDADPQRWTVSGHPRRAPKPTGGLARRLYTSSFRA